MSKLSMIAGCVVATTAAAGLVIATVKVVNHHRTLYQKCLAELKVCPTEPAFEHDPEHVDVKGVYDNRTVYVEVAVNGVVIAASGPCPHGWFERHAVVRAIADRIHTELVAQNINSPVALEDPAVRKVIRQGISQVLGNAK